MSAAAAAKPKKSAELSNENVESGTPPNLLRLAHYTMGGQEALDAYERDDPENGGIDLDVASSQFWNFHLVRARRFYTKEDNALQKIWRARQVFINPPGTTDDDRIQGSVPRLFWERALGFYEQGLIECFFWVGFNMSQLQVLQGGALHPLNFVTNFPASRVDYYEQPWEEVENPRVLVDEHTNKCIGKGGICKPTCRLGKPSLVKKAIAAAPPRRQGAPPRPSYVTFVGPRDPARAKPMMDRFIEGADMSRPDLVPGALVRPVIVQRKRAA